MPKAFFMYINIVYFIIFKWNIELLPMFIFELVQYTFYIQKKCKYKDILYNSNMTSFFHFVDKQRFIDGIISFAHAPVNMTDFFISNINCVRHFPQT